MSEGWVQERSDGCVVMALLVSAASWLVIWVAHKPVQDKVNIWHRWFHCCCAVVPGIFVETQDRILIQNKNRNLCALVVGCRWDVCVSSPWEELFCESLLIRAKSTQTSHPFLNFSRFFYLTETQRMDSFSWAPVGAPAEGQNQRPHRFICLPMEGWGLSRQTFHSRAVSLEMPHRANL